MSWFVVDVEATGPVAGPYSMHQVGVVKVADLSKTFYAEFKPLNNGWIPDALRVCNVTWEEINQYPHPMEGMLAFERFIEENNEGGKPIFVSDNLAFDWSFVNYYFCVFRGKNPFGWSGRRIGDIYSGLVGKASQPWKNRYRKTKHDHNPVNDAMGNAEALRAFRDELGFKVTY